MDTRTRRPRQDGRQHARADAPRRPHRRRLRPQPRRQRRRQPRGAGRAAAQPQGGLGDGAGRRPDPRRPSTSSASCSARATSSSTAATPLDRRPDATPSCSPSKGIGFVDCGVSGGVWGLENGYALMFGGDDDDVAKVQPVFDALKPEGEFGFVHAGKVGAGHFSKMVHNGIEYAMMQAYAEGWELLEKVDLVDNVTEVFRLLARGHRDPVLAARPAGRGARRGRRPRRDRAATPRTPARAAGPSRPASTTPSPMPGDHRVAVRPVRLPAGRQPGDEGGRRDAQPVRRPRRARPSAPPGGDRRRRLTGRRVGPRVRRPPVAARLPLLRRRRGRARARGDRVRRAATARARPTWSRRSTTCRGSARTGSPPTRRWCGAAPTGPSSGPRWSATAARRCSRSRSTRARPTGPGSTGRRCRGPASCSAWCARCCSPPRTWPWSRATRPSARRFLDDLLVLRAPRLPASAPTTTGCSSSATRCSRPPAPRAAGRTSHEAALSTLDVWDAHLARTGAELLAARLGLVDDLRPVRRQRPTRRSRAGATRDDAATRLQAVLRARRRRLTDRDELTAAAARPSSSAAATTSSTAASRLVGPHRDDLLLLARATLPVKGYASHGESWSFALALRLASYDLLRADGDDPVLILDDVFAELDTERRAQLAELVAGAEQVLVTAAVPDDVPEALRGRALRRGRRGGDAVTTDDRRRDPASPEPTEPARADDGLDLARTHRPRAGRPRRRRPAASKAAPAAPAAAAHRPGLAAPTPTTATRRPLDADARAGWSPTTGGRPTLRVHGVFARWAGARRPRGRRSTATPESFADGRLVVRTDSTAWATQMTLLAPDRRTPAQRGARRRHGRA